MRTDRPLQPFSLSDLNGNFGSLSRLRSDNETRGDLFAVRQQITERF